MMKTKAMLMMWTRAEAVSVLKKKVVMYRKQMEQLRRTMWTRRGEGTLIGRRVE